MLKGEKGLTTEQNGSVVLLCSILTSDVFIVYSQHAPATHSIVSETFSEGVVVNLQLRYLQKRRHN